MNSVTSRVESFIGKNAQMIKYGSYEFIASFKEYPEGDIYCAGALISKKYVITAAHCLEDETPRSIRIIFSLAPEQIGLQHKVDSWMTYVHWSKRYGIPYDESFDHDIAIVKVSNYRGIMIFLADNYYQINSMIYVLMLT